MKGRLVVSPLIKCGDKIVYELSSVSKVIGYDQPVLDETTRKYKNKRCESVRDAYRLRGSHLGTKGEKIYDGDGPTEVHERIRALHPDDRWDERQWLTYDGVEKKEIVPLEDEKWQD